MDAYIYQAALYCAECGEQIRHSLRFQAKEVILRRDDSDSWPQGPYPDGGGEADYPQHCAECLVFLENPLTDDGARYVREAIDAHKETNRGMLPTLQEWSNFYDIPWGQS
jgi:hypothetical protein